MEWQPIKTAPRDGTVIVLYLPWMNAARTGQWSSRPRAGRPGWCIHWYRTYKAQVVSEPTHWMPLPPPPEDAT